MPRMIKRLYTPPKMVEIQALKDPKGVQTMTEGELYEVSLETAQVLEKCKRAKIVRKLYVEDSKKA